MKLIRRNGNLFSPVPELFDDFFNRDLFNWRTSNFSNTSTTVPAVNIKETNVNYEVEVAAPGMTKDDFKVELDGNILTISSNRINEKEDVDDERYSMKEFSYQSFQRIFNLQKDVVDVEKIEAKYENGILKLSLPRKEEAKKISAKQIAVK